MRRFEVRLDEIALSSERKVYKTESFVSLTRKTLSIDAFISRVAEGIFREGITLSECCSVQTEDGLYTFYICQKCDLYEKNDVVFYKYLSAKPNDGGVDRSVKEYLSSRKKLTFILKSADEEAPTDDLRRLYLVSGADGMVNFPHLNENQRRIVETEDANMLVQGVAGSGKTNVCVEKIVYCACRNYRGRVLYTTFSRGLLSETRDRTELFLRNISDFVEDYEAGKIVFLDDDHKGAVENKLGILFSVDEDGEIVAALKRIAKFLRENVDYLLIEDIYASKFGECKIANESTFINEYLSGKGFRLSGAIERIKNISPEIIYKEIYGMIFGKFEQSAPKEMLSKEEYIEARRESFTPRESEIIYTVSQDYVEFLKKQGYTDNNLMSRELLDSSPSTQYSVGIIDEVQDFTQVNLCLIKTLCRKMFCVGDALQMINPSYFSFAYLKRLMYGDVTGVSELKHNYRSSERIEQIAERLGEMNIQRFGTHSFVLKGESVPSKLDSHAVFIKDKNFASLLGDKKFENLTVIVGSQRKKERLKKQLGSIEILTVAEAKGLERNTVVLVDVLSDSADKWRYLNEMTLNRKTADENSVFRYYFNLFYVGISRARQNLFVVEADYPKFFDRLFDDCFERRSRERALQLLGDIAGRLEINDDEFLERIEKFCALEQYDNARQAADRLSDDALRTRELAYIDVHESCLRYGRYRDAGVEFWRRGMDKDAREMFTRSGDEKLFPLMDACLEGGSSALDPEIVKFFPLVSDNELARSIILDTLDRDNKQISAAFREASAKLRRKA